MRFHESAAAVGRPLNETGSGVWKVKEHRLRLANATYVEIDFSGQSLDALTIANCFFDRCKFDQMNVGHACFGEGTQQSRFVNCSFSNSSIRGPTVGNARFVHCSFNRVLLRDWLCMAAEFVDCVFSGRLHGAVFNGTVSEYMAADLGREKNQFEGNDFSKARLDNVAFRTGIDLRKQKLPEGANYRRIDDAPRFIDRARVGILTWPASEKRRLALVAVDSLKFEATNGQNDIFISFDTYSPTVRAAMEEVLSQFS